MFHQRNDIFKVLYDTADLVFIWAHDSINNEWVTDELMQGHWSLRQVLKEFFSIILWKSVIWIQWRVL